MSKNIFYRLTNDYNGPLYALDVLPDNSGNLKMARIGDYSGQFWRMMPATDAPGKFRLSTLYKGVERSLDVVKEGETTKPALTATSSFAGQLWTLTKTSMAGDVWKLSNDSTGADMFLDVYPDEMRPRMNGGDPTGSHWTLTLAKIQ